MAQNVNVTTTNWRTTGANVSVPQFSQNVSITWVDNNGVPQSWNGVVKFPDILLTMYSQNPTWTIEQMQKIIYEFGRKQLGIDA